MIDSDKAKLNFPRPKMTRKEYHESVQALIVAAKKKGNEREVMRFMARNDLFFFCIYVMKQTYLDDDFAYAFICEVQKNKYERLWIMAREHFKSTVLTILSTIWELMLDSSLTYIIYSYVDTAAKNFFYKPIKKLLEERAEILNELFPESMWANPISESDLWKEEQLHLKGHPPGRKEATIEWKSVMNQKTGAHFDRGLYDDISTPESVKTTDSIRNLKDAYAMSYNTLARGAKTMVTGTFYHFTDVYNDIIEKGTLDVLIQPCVDEDGIPVRFTLSELEAKKKIMGSNIFASQMMCDPKLASKSSFKKEWIKFWDPVNWKGLNITIHVDPARQKSKKSDYTTMLVIGVDANENYMIIDIVHDKLNLKEKTEKIFFLHRKYKPLQIYYESVGIQSDVDHIELEQARINYRFNIVGLNQWEVKENRIASLQPLFEEGKIYIPSYGTCVNRNYEGEYVDTAKEMVQEILNYPFGSHDDIIDPLAQIKHPNVSIKFPDENTYESLLRDDILNKVGRSYIEEDNSTYVPYSC